MTLLFEHFAAQLLTKDGNLINRWLPFKIYSLRKKLFGLKETSEYSPNHVCSSNGRGRERNKTTIICAQI